MAAVVAGPWPAEAMPEPGDGAHVRVHGPYEIYVRMDERAVDDRRWFVTGLKTGKRWSQLAGRSPRVLRPGRAALDSAGRIEALFAMTRDLGDYGNAHLVGGLLTLLAEGAEDEHAYAAVVRCIERAKAYESEVSP